MTISTDNSKFIINTFGAKQICLSGVGRLFFESGFPVSLSVSELKKKGIEVSMLHVADECLKNGWSAKTTINKLVADFEEDIEGGKIDKELLTKFCYAEYEEQREMIFEYLFGINWGEPEVMKEVVKNVCNF